MADYATLAEFGKLGLTKEALKKFPVDQQTEHLSAASRRIDSYLAARYDLPLTAWGKDLTEAACIIAAYQLMSGGGGWNPVPGSADEHLYLRYKDIIKWLELVPTGKVTPTDIQDSSSVAGDDGLFPIIDSDPPRGW